MSRLVIPSMILLLDKGNVQKVARVMDATTKENRENRVKTRLGYRAGHPLNRNALLLLFAKSFKHLPG